MMSPDRPLLTHSTYKSNTTTPITSSYHNSHNTTIKQKFHDLLLVATSKHNHSVWHSYLRSYCYVHITLTSKSLSLWYHTHTKRIIWIKSSLSKKKMDQKFWTSDLYLSNSLHEIEKRFLSMLELWFKQRR